MQSITPKNRTVYPWLAIGLLATGQSLLSTGLAKAQPADKTSRVGRITHLDDQSGLPDQPNALLGHIYSFDKSADDAFEALQDGDLKQAVDAARNMARAANEIADKVAEGQEALGEAAARIEIAATQLKRLDDGVPPDPAGRQKLAEDIGAFRNLLASRLASHRERYRSVGPNDEQQKETLRKQMAAIADRIEHFDEVRQAIDRGGSAVVPDSATGWMRKQFDDLKASLDEEKAALLLTATAMQTQLADTEREIERSFRLIELQASLPLEQIRRLKATQASTKRTLSRLVAEHGRATEAVLNMIGTGNDGPAPPEKDLLQRVDRLLGDAAGGPAPDED